MTAAETRTIRDLCQFSKLNFTNFSSQTLRDLYGGDMHPKVLEVALNIYNEKLVSSNQRCIGALIAIKYVIHDF
jgi:hypothetical protein